ncbi:DUF1365 domain-containing protein [Amaricoccus tamworthensis]|uniref:DUF1365 domain-containing protein n=1 Tax=Amaricoccus tamworthensis TaxID=57002 RepID=UPI003C79BC8C
MTLAERLAGGDVLAMPSMVTHARRGSVRHNLKVRADFVLFAPETFRPPALMSHNGFNLTAWHDVDHGGERGAGRGVAWVREQMDGAGIATDGDRVVALLTQPRFLGYWFNPVSFWMVIEGDDVVAVIAEVNNTFGQRHSYLLTPGAGDVIGPDETLTARKVFHVSPFQDVSGEYQFNFTFRPNRIAIAIRHVDGADGVNTAMAGDLKQLDNLTILAAALRRPGGPMRVIAQIYWHALQLKLKGARWRARPALPHEEVTR